MMKVRKAVIPAAGFGTRFLPETKAMPKEMLPIVDKPTIQYIVEEILQSGIEQILIISGHAKRAIEDHFDSSPELEEHLYESGKMELLKQVRAISSIKIHYVRQKYQRGLGGRHPLRQGLHRRGTFRGDPGGRCGVQRSGRTGPEAAHGPV